MSNNPNSKLPSNQFIRFNQKVTSAKDQANKDISPWWCAKTYNMPALAPIPEETPYPVEALPLDLRDAVLEVHRKDGVPIATTATYVNGFVGFAVQSMANLQIDDDEEIGLAPFCLIVTSSRDETNTLSGRFATALNEIDTAGASSHKAAMNAFKGECRRWKAEGKVLDGMLTSLLLAGQSTEPMRAELVEHELRQPIKPRPPRFLFDDIEGGEFIDALEGNNHSVAVLADESAKLMKSASFSKIVAINNASKDIAVPLKRGRDDSVIVRNARVGLILAIPHSLRDTYLSEHDSDALGRDKLAHYLFVDSKHVAEDHIKSDADSSSIAVDALNARFKELHGKRKQLMANGASTLPVVKLDKDAAELLRNFKADAKAYSKGGAALHDIADVVQAAPKHACRLAGWFHCFTGQPGDVTRDTLARAITIVVWHTVQFKRRFGELPLVPQVVLDAQELDSWMTRKAFSKGWLSIEKKWVRGNVTPTYLRDDKRLDAALAFLVTEKRIRLIYGPRRQCQIQVHVGF